MEVRELFGRALDLLYPDPIYCICCGNLVDETRAYGLCDHCIRHMIWDTSEPEEKSGIESMRCCQYGIYERTLIFSLKYNGNRYIARHIAEIMRDKIKSVGRDGDYDLIVPVPLHKRKIRKRGFNQAALIAKYLASYLGIECLPDALIRVRETSPMRGLSKEERAENIKGCFELNNDIKEKIEGKRVLLLDDIYTTGATASECRKTLEEGHPGSISFISFAAR